MNILIIENFFVCLFVLRWCFFLQVQLSQNSFCRHGWPLLENQEYSYLCLQSPGIEQIHHHLHSQLRENFLKLSLLSSFIIRKLYECSRFIFLFWEVFVDVKVCHPALEILTEKMFIVITILLLRKHLCYIEFTHIKFKSE